MLPVPPARDVPQDSTGAFRYRGKTRVRRASHAPREARHDQRTRRVTDPAVPWIGARLVEQVDQDERCETPVHDANERIPYVNPRGLHRSSRYLPISAFTTSRVLVSK